MMLPAVHRIAGQAIIGTYPSQIHVEAAPTLS
jgi:hypothetical protein